MRHPQEKYIRIEVLSIILAGLIGITALIKGYLILLFVSLYFIVLNLFCEAIIEWTCYRKAQAGKQLIRGVMLLLLTTYLILKI